MDRETLTISSVTFLWTGVANRRGEGATDKNMDIDRAGIGNTTGCGKVEPDILAFRRQAKQSETQVT